MSNTESATPAAAEHADQTSQCSTSTQAEKPSDTDENKERLEREAAMSDAELAALAEAALTLKAEANQKFGAGNYEAACDLYTEAIEKAPLAHVETRAVIYSNRAAAHLKLQRWSAAAADASAAIDAGAANEKALERRALAYSHNEEQLDLAIADYKSLVEQFPSRVGYATQVAQLEQRSAERKARLQEEMMSQLKTLGNMCLKPFGLSTDSFQLKQQESGGYSIQMKK